MNIITFVFVIVASLVALLVALFVLVKASTFLANFLVKAFTFLGLFFWNKARSVQAVIKEKAEQKSKPVQPPVLEEIQEQIQEQPTPPTPAEYAYLEIPTLEIPTYIRKGKTLV